MKILGGGLSFLVIIIIIIIFVRQHKACRLNNYERV